MSRFVKASEALLDVSVQMPPAGLAIEGRTLPSGLPSRLHDCDAIGPTVGKSSIMSHVTCVVELNEIIEARPTPEVIRRLTSPDWNTAAPAVKTMPLPVAAARVSVVAGFIPCSFVAGDRKLIVDSVHDVWPVRESFRGAYSGWNKYSTSALWQYFISEISASRYGEGIS